MKICEVPACMGVVGDDAIRLCEDCLNAWLDWRYVRRPQSRPVTEDLRPVYDTWMKVRDQVVAREQPALWMVWA